MTDNLPATTKLNAFLAKAKAAAPPAKKARSELLAAATVPQTARLVISMDATASREESWSAAKEIMSGMFEQVPAGLDVSLAYYGGERFRMTPFVSTVGPLIEEAARVRCVSGHTQILKTMNYVAKRVQEGPIGGLILIGDAFEETEEDVLSTARRLKLLGTPVFTFFEGDGRHAESVFQKIAIQSGGAHFKFDSNAPAMLREILAGVAAYVHGGMKELAAVAKRLPGAKLLLTHMTKTE